MHGTVACTAVAAAWTTTALALCNEYNYRQVEATEAVKCAILNDVTLMIR